MIIEHNVLAWTETQMVKVQNATGLPIWRFCRGMWLLWGMLSIFYDFAFRQVNIPLEVFMVIAPLLIAASITNAGSRLQAIADDSNAVVPNPSTTFVWGSAYRLLVVSAALAKVAQCLYRPTLATVLEFFSSAPSVVGAYLLFCNYWPITGSTIWQQVKAGFQAAGRNVIQS